MVQDHIGQSRGRLKETGSKLGYLNNFSPGGGKVKAELVGRGLGFIVHCGCQVALPLSCLYAVTLDHCGLDVKRAIFYFLSTSLLSFMLGL